MNKHLLQELQVFAQISERSIKKTVKEEKRIVNKPLTKFLRDTKKKYELDNINYKPFEHYWNLSLIKDEKKLVIPFVMENPLTLYSVYELWKIIDNYKLFNQ